MLEGVVAGISGQEVLLLVGDGVRNVIIGRNAAVLHEGNNIWRAGMQNGDRIAVGRAGVHVLERGCELPDKLPQPPPGPAEEIRLPSVSEGATLPAAHEEHKQFREQRQSAAEEDYDAASGEE